MLLISLIGLISWTSISLAETYTYDQAGRLTQVAYTDGSSISYAYDANGSQLGSTVAVNPPPTAVNDSANTGFETAVTVDVAANDSDANGTLDLTSVAIITDTTNGATSINGATGVVTYTPNVNFSGDDTFTYTINDDLGDISNVATVTITVEAPPENEAPVANNDSSTTAYETAVAVDVAANDSDANGTLDLTSVVIVTDATNGTTSINGTTGAVTYTPNTNFSGGDIFTYTINDDLAEASNVATVSITVEAPPANQAPVANNESITTNFNTAAVISVLTNDTDNDGTLDSSTVTVATKPAYGTTTVANNGQVTYTPNAGYSGADSFTYTVMDDDGATSNIATISVTVNSESVTPPPPSSSGGGSSSFGLLLVLLMLLSLNKQLINTRHS